MSAQGVNEMGRRHSDRLPSATPLRRSEAALFADELAKAAELIAGPRMPETREFEGAAELILAAGHYAIEELLDTSTAERAQLYKLMAECKAGWARMLRKIIDSEAPPTELEVKKAAPYKGVDIIAAVKAHRCLSDIGEISRHSQEAVALCSEDIQEGTKARPPYISFLPPKLRESPRSLQYPGRKSSGWRKS